MSTSLPGKEEESSHRKYVKITLADNEGNQIEYKVKRHIPFGKIVELYASSNNKKASQLRLSWKGRPVQIADTADSLEMEDEEEMEIVAPQVGG